MAKKVKRQEAIYARQSVDKKDSVSIETQIDECKKHCFSNAPRIYQDKGYSGKNTMRPDVQRLISDIETGMIEKVVVYKLDRISRNITDFYKLYEVMQNHDCEFVSHSESFDTTSSMGRAMMGILAVFAQMERENIVTRVKDNYDYRLKSGTWATGKAPFGFKNGKTADGQKTLIPVPEEMEAVRFMFETYASKPNVSLGQIQTMLIKQGLTGHQSEKGLGRTTIGHILSNPIYTSADQLLYQYYSKFLIDFINPKEEWDGSRACSIIGLKGRTLSLENNDGVSAYLTNVKPNISSHTFIMVQERLSQNKRIASDNTPNHALQELSGLLKCADCGSAVKMRSYPSLTCTGRDQRKICSTSFAGIKLAPIQEKVSEAVQERLRSLYETTAQKRQRREKLTEEIATLEKQLNNLIDLAMTSDSVRDAVKSRIEALTITINEKKLSMVFDDDDYTIGLRVHSDMHLQGRKLLSAITADGDVLFEYKDLPVEKKQTVLRVLVKRVLLHPDGTIEMDWK